MDINFETVTIKELEQTHQNYNKYIDIWNYTKKMYIGEIDLINELPTFYREHSEDKKFRSTITPYINFFKKITHIIPEMVFAQDVMRSGDYFDKINDFVESVNGNHLNLKNYMFDIIKIYTSIGKIVTLVDSDVPGQPYVVTYFPENLIRWDTEKNGSLKWALLKENVYKNIGLKSKPEVVTVYRYFDKENICVWEYYKNKLHIIDGYPKRNEIKQVPIVIFDKFSKTNGIYMPDLKSYELAKLNMAFINTLSSLMLSVSALNGLLILPEDEIEMVGGQIDSTMSKMIDTYGQAELRKMTSEKLSINQAIIENQNTKGITRTVAPIDTINSQINVLQYLMNLIKEYTGVSNLDERESGIAKSFRFEQMKSELQNLADFVENKEKEIINIALLIKNPTMTYDIKKIKVNYERNYNVMDVTDIFSELKQAEDSLLLSLPSFATNYVKEKALQIAPELDTRQIENIEKEVSKLLTSTAILKQLNKKREV